MVSKKYTVLIALLLVFGVTAFAQTAGWDWKDSSVVPVKSITQYNEFKQNKNPFPPKPRNAWELGVSTGPSFIAGDVTPKLGIGGSITLRKAITNTLSFRIGYFGSLNYGKAGTVNFGNVPGYQVYPNYAAVYDGNGKYWSNSWYSTPNYRNTTHMLAFDLISSLNTFSNYRGDPKVNIYALAGVNLLAAATKINLPPNGDWFWAKNNGQLGLLGLSKSGGHEMWLIAGSFGGGISFKVNPKINVGFEERITKPLFRKFGYLDGFDGGSTDTYFYSAFKLNYNLY